MKKTLLLLTLVAITVTSFGQTTTPRFGKPPGDDNTGRTLTLSSSTVALTNPITFKPNASYTYINPAPLKGNDTVKVSVTGAHSFDEVNFTFYGAGAANSGTLAHDTIFWGTGLQPTGGVTYLVTDSTKVATASFIFNGTVWVERFQAKQ